MRAMHRGGSSITQTQSRLSVSVPDILRCHSSALSHSHCIHSYHPRLLHALSQVNSPPSSLPRYRPGFDTLSLNQPSLFPRRIVAARLRHYWSQPPHHPLSASHPSHSSQWSAANSTLPLPPSPPHSPLSSTHSPPNSFPPPTASPSHMSAPPLPFLPPPPEPDEMGGEGGKKRRRRRQSRITPSSILVRSILLLLLGGLAIIEGGKMFLARSILEMDVLMWNQAEMTRVSLEESQNIAQKRGASAAAAWVHVPVLLPAPLSPPELSTLFSSMGEEERELIALAWTHQDSWPWDRIRTWIARLVPLDADEHYRIRYESLRRTGIPTGATHTTLMDEEEEENGQHTQQWSPSAWVNHRLKLLIMPWSAGLALGQAAALLNLWQQERILEETFHAKEIEGVEGVTTTVAGMEAIEIETAVSDAATNVPPTARATGSGSDSGSAKLPPNAVALRLAQGVLHWTTDEERRKLEKLAMRRLEESRVLLATLRYERAKEKHVEGNESMRFQTMGNVAHKQTLTSKSPSSRPSPAPSSTSTSASTRSLNTCLSTIFDRSSWSWLHTSMQLAMLTRRWKEARQLSQQTHELRAQIESDLETIQSVVPLPIPFLSWMVENETFVQRGDSLETDDELLSIWRRIEREKRRMKRRMIARSRARAAAMRNKSSSSSMPVDQCEDAPKGIDLQPQLIAHAEEEREKEKDQNGSGNHQR